MLDSTLQMEILFLFKTLNNPRRLQIMFYLEKASFATNGVIAKVLQLHPGTVSKDLSLLCKVELLEKEKVGTQRLFSVSNKWKHIKDLNRT